MKNQISALITEKRLEKHLNKSQLAKKLGVSPAAIGQYENGTHNPKLKVLLEMSEVLNWDLINNKPLINYEEIESINIVTNKNEDSQQFVRNRRISHGDKLDISPESDTLVSPKPKTMLIIEEENPILGDLKIIVPPQKAIPVFNSDFHKVLLNEVIYAHTDNWTNNPIYADCDAVIRHHGESMSPIIGDGYYMGIKHIDKNQYFPQGSIYTIITSGFKLTRYIHRTENPKYFKISGASNGYPPEEIPFDEILSMWHVKVAVPYGVPKMFD